MAPTNEYTIPKNNKVENEIIGLVITRKIEIEDAINKAVVNFVKKVSDSTVFVIYKTNFAVVSLRSVFVRYSKSIPKVFLNTNLDNS